MAPSLNALCYLGFCYSTDFIPRCGRISSLRTCSHKDCEVPRGSSHRACRGALGCGVTRARGTDRPGDESQHCHLPGVISMCKGVNLVFPFPHQWYEDENTHIIGLVGWWNEMTCVAQCLRVFTLSINPSWFLALGRCSVHFIKGVKHTCNWVFHLLGPWYFILEFYINSLQNVLQVWSGSIVTKQCELGWQTLLSLY